MKGEEEGGVVKTEGRGVRGGRMDGKGGRGWEKGGRRDKKEAKEKNWKIKVFFLSFRSLHINNIFIFIYIGKNTHDSTGDYR